MKYTFYKWMNWLPWIANSIILAFVGLNLYMLVTTRELIYVFFAILFVFIIFPIRKYPSEYYSYKEWWKDKPFKKKPEPDLREQLYKQITKDIHLN